MICMPYDNKGGLQIPVSNIKKINYDPFQVSPQNFLGIWAWTSLPSHTHHQRLNLLKVACMYIVRELLLLVTTTQTQPKTRKISEFL